MKAKLDLSLYAVLDPGRCRERPLPEMAASAAKGGATLLQLRCKAESSRSFFHAAQAVQRALSPFAIPLLINDRVGVALAANCAGVHLGADDLPVEEVRRMLGPNAIIGATVRTIAEVDALAVGVLDYASIGGVFDTASKHNRQSPIGFDGFKHLRRRLAARAPELPVCAIAGIGHRNAGDIFRAGADGIAVVSDIFMAADVIGATRRLSDVAKATRAEPTRT